MIEVFLFFRFINILKLKTCKKMFIKFIKFNIYDSVLLNNNRIFDTIKKEFIIKIIKRGGL